MKQTYINSILLIERLHRRFLDVIKTELDKNKIEDINNVQTLILYNINDEELTIGELTNRGYYLGSNVSYNVKKLVENEFLVQEKSPHDKRSSKVKLSEKGKALCEKIDDLYEKNVLQLASTSISQEKLDGLNKNLEEIEDFWTNYINDIFRK